MRKNTKSMKVTSCKIIALLGIGVFSLAMMAFIINACTAMNITLAWILFGVMIFGFGLFLFGSICYIKLDYERIKEYFRKIIN